MGFIEDEKRKAREKIEREERERKRQGEKRREMRSREKLLKYDHQQYCVSVAHANESNFPVLIKELRDIIPITEGKRYLENKEIRRWDEIFAFLENDNGNPITGGQFTLGWNYEWSHDGYAYKKVNIKFYPNGNISIEGNWRGNTSLCLNEWKNCPEIQEKALEKAFKNPGEGYFRPTPVEMGGYGL